MTTIHHPTAVSFHPVAKPVSGSIAVPGSKSITNRAVLCAAMARGTSLLRGVLESEDTVVMVDAWKQLGLDIDWNRDARTLTIGGCAGQPKIARGQLFVANSGTTIRFLTAALAATEGEYLLDGVARMRERPIGDLLDGLRDWGATVRSENEQHADCPPVRLYASGLAGGQAHIAGNISSQFLSGMLMASPYAKSPVQIHVRGELVSKPYIRITTEVMKSFGVTVNHPCLEHYEVFAPQTYQACEYEIEPDASAASYFFAIAAITGGTIRVAGLHRNSLQGDVGFVDVLQQMGCTVRHGDDFIEVSGRAARGVDVDMNAISDTVQTLAAVALFADGPTRVRGVAHNRHKETDRIGDLATELRRLGASIEEHQDGLTIHPRPLHGAPLETYNDHRMAMSLALTGLMVPGVKIHNPRCTEKTYPEFFEDLGRMIGQSPRFD